MSTSAPPAGPRDQAASASTASAMQDLGATNENYVKKHQRPWKLILAGHHGTPHHILFWPRSHNVMPRFTFSVPFGSLFKYKPGKFNYALEQDIRAKLDTLPSVSRIYTHPDGTPRVPSDSEFKTIAELQNLFYRRNHSQWNFLLPGIPREQLELFRDNSQDLQNFQFVGKDAGKVIDKIPYKDETTGELKWRVVRETEKAEGWELPYFYIILPVLAYIVYTKYTAQMKKRSEEGPEWAQRELRLRAMEEYFHGDTEKAKQFLENEGKSERELRDRDDLVIARILAGDYDKLASLKKKLPLDLVPQPARDEKIGI